MIDVICYGALLPDQVLALPRLPRAGEGIHTLHEQMFLGGEPCNVGGHLARWGLHVVLAGNNLGDDPRATFVERELRARPNTTYYSRRDPLMWTPTCYILTTPDGERTIIASWPQQPSFTLPPAEVVEQCRLVSVCNVGPAIDVMVDLAHSHGKPIVLADSADSSELRMHGVAILTTSRAMLANRYQLHDVQGWIDHTWQATRALIVVSDGAHPLRVRTPDGRDLSAYPPAITPVDTTGAGDALKAGVMYGWLNGWPIEHTLDIALKAASQVCLYPGPCPEVALEH